MLLLFFSILQEFIKAEEDSTCTPPKGYNESTFVFRCNEEITTRTGGKNKIIYIISCSFKNIKVKNAGAAIYITITNLQESHFIYNCTFESCISSGSSEKLGVGGAIRIESPFSAPLLNITKCFFKENKALTGGAIYFKAIHGVISGCTFINNIATNKLGGDIYFTSSDKEDSNREALLIEKCEFMRDASSTTESMIYLKWIDLSDFQFQNNKVNITESASNVLFFNTDGFNLDTTATLICENNLINNLKYVVSDEVREGKIGEILFAGFSKIPEPENPDVPGPSNPNCPPPPDDYVDIEKGQTPTNRYAYGCEVSLSTKLDADRCVLYAYSCTFDSINSDKANGGAIHLSTGSVQQPAPKGSCTISNCTFCHCRGGSGGAIYLESQDGDRFTGITNCTFENNTATKDTGDVGGGALFIYAAYVTVSNCTFIDNQANAKGQVIYYLTFEFESDTENPFLITNCTFYQYHVSSNSSLIFLEWTDNSDLYFNYNTIRLADDLIAYLLEDKGAKEIRGNLSCHANALLPSHELLCRDKDSALYKHIMYDFQNTEAPKDDIVIGATDECTTTKDNHCKTINENENEYEHVKIEVSDFTGYESKGDNGGAVYLVNTGVTCTKTTYKACKAEEKGGGAIFYYNKVDKVNRASFQDVTIESCEAAFGGGAYVYSKSKQNDVIFNGCTFRSNTASTSGKDFYGGGALYMTVAEAHVTNNLFLMNKGGTVKVNDKFDKVPDMNQPSSASELGSSLSSFVTISSCTFESEENARQPSILFVNSRGAKAVKACVFTGRLAKGTYHIDAQESSGVVVQSCRFSSTMRQAFNANVVAAAANNQAAREGLGGTARTWFAVAAFGVACCAAVIALVVVKRRGGEKEENENREASLESLESENKL